MVTCRKNINFVEMKKYLLLVSVALLMSVTGMIPSRAAESDNGRRVVLLVREYSSMPNFEVVNLGRLGLGLVKATMRTSMDADDLALLDAIKDVKRVIITNYEDCTPGLKAEFTQRLNKLLDKDQLLVEAKDSGETVSIYGVPSDNGDKVTDLIINVPGDGALICIQGSIPMAKVAEIIEEQN